MSNQQSPEEIGNRPAHTATLREIYVAHALAGVSQYLSAVDAGEEAVQRAEAALAVLARLSGWTPEMPASRAQVRPITLSDLDEAS